MEVPVREGEVDGLKHLVEIENKEFEASLRIEVEGEKLRITLIGPVSYNDRTGDSIDIVVSQDEMAAAFDALGVAV